ncbi:MAG: hypothetical protein AAGA93_16790 [Actinomycetota bacterium]
MEIVFERTGTRRYAVEVRRACGTVLRMDQAPGFDPWFPHDLQHLVVEEQLGLDHGIFGRVARGGSASAFSTVEDGALAHKRAAMRRQRRLKRRDAVLAAGEPNHIARSERATSVAWHDWLANSDDPELRVRSFELADRVRSTLARMDPDERSALVAALPRMRRRIDEVATQWSTTPIGGSITITWAPLTAGTARGGRIGTARGGRIGTA